MNPQTSYVRRSAALFLALAAMALSSACGGKTVYVGDVDQSSQNVDAGKADVVVPTTATSECQAVQGDCMIDDGTAVVDPCTGLERSSGPQKCADPKAFCCLPKNECQAVHGDCMIDDGTAFVDPCTGLGRPIGSQKCAGSKEICCLP